MKKLSLAERDVIFRLLAVRGWELTKFLEEERSVETERKCNEELEVIESARAKVFSMELHEYMDGKNN